MSKDYYNILGLDKSASKDQIKKAYRKMAIKYHPDKNPGDDTAEDKFKEASEAYQILSDDAKKQQYDTYGTTDGSPFGKGGNFDINDIFNHFGFGGDNPFEGFFGRRHTYNEFYENLDIKVNLIVSLRDVYKGDPIKVQYKRNKHCIDCDGTGFDRESHSDDCEMCDGTGIDGYTIDGQPKMCEYCRGVGKIYSGTCKTCNGEKVVLMHEEFDVNNIQNVRGSVIQTLPHYGHQSKYFRNKRGFLKMHIIYEHLPNYEISNDFDLLYKIDLHYQDAIDGCSIPFKLLNGEDIDIIIPPKTQDKDTVSIDGKGLLVDNKGNRNRLLIGLNVIIDYDKIK